jgi:hypothetical protein
MEIQQVCVEIKKAHHQYVENSNKKPVNRFIWQK